MYGENKCTVLQITSSENKKENGLRERQCVLGEKKIRAQLSSKKVTCKDAEGKKKVEVLKEELRGRERVWVEVGGEKKPRVGLLGGGGGGEGSGGKNTNAGGREGGREGGQEVENKQGHMRTPHCLSVCLSVAGRE